MNIVNNAMDKDNGNVKTMKGAPVNMKERFGRIARRCLALLAAFALPLAAMGTASASATEAASPDLQVAAVSASSVSLKFTGVGDAHTVRARVVVEGKEAVVSDLSVAFSETMQSKATVCQAVVVNAGSDEAPAATDIVLSGGDTAIAAEGAVNVGTLNFAAAEAVSEVRVSVTALQVVDGDYKIATDLSEGDADLPETQTVSLADDSDSDDSQNDDVSDDDSQGGDLPNDGTDTDSEGLLSATGVAVLGVAIVVVALAAAAAIMLVIRRRNSNR